MQSPLSVCALVVLGCGFPAAHSLGRPVDKDTISYWYQVREWEKRDASWRKFQEPKVLRNAHFLNPWYLDGPHLLGEEKSDKVNCEVQREKEKVEKETQYRVWQEREKIKDQRAHKLAEVYRHE